MNWRIFFTALGLVMLIVDPRNCESVAPPTELDPVLPRFVRIEPGTFLMGSPRDDEAPVHSVVVDRPFLLATTEVTRALWTSVTGTSAGYFSACGDDCPVETISWDEAVEFCNSLSARLGFEPVYYVAGETVDWVQDACGFRLPTEAEWEYACRAGTSTPFSTGNCLEASIANFDGYFPPYGCSEGVNRQEPIPVGSFESNGWGLYDMHGNVSEWCWDAYTRYGVSQQTVTAAAAADTLRCYRGGSWKDGAIGCRSSVRYYFRRDRSRDFLGLRLARTILPR
jgi:formylglycine-generating enzyme required for sulfatase activity